MDTLTKAAIFENAVPLVVGGKTYRVRPLDLREVVTGEFMDSKLYCPGEDEPPANWQALFMESEDYREQLDKWLGRLVTLDGAPQSLDTIGDWTDTDLGRFLSLVVQGSGLTRKTEDGNTEPTTPETWLDVVSELQYRAHMSWDEVMTMPLLRANAVRERILRQAANDITNSAAGLLGAATGRSTAQPAKDPRFGETPQFTSRDEYFDFINKHS